MAGIPNLDLDFKSGFDWIWIYRYSHLLANLDFISNLDSNLDIEKNQSARDGSFETIVPAARGRARHANEFQ